MKKLVLLFCVLAPAAFAGPFGQGDAAKGKPLEAKHCVGCHVRMFGGDGTGIYTRKDRKIKDGTALMQRVAACNAQTNAGLFQEDEEHIAAYLNATHYRFK